MLSTECFRCSGFAPIVVILCLSYVFNGFLADGYPYCYSFIFILGGNLSDHFCCVVAWLEVSVMVIVQILVVWAFFISIADCWFSWCCKMNYSNSFWCWSILFLTLYFVMHNSIMHCFEFCNLVYLCFNMVNWKGSNSYGTNFIAWNFLPSWVWFYGNRFPNGYDTIEYIILWDFYNPGSIYILLVSIPHFSFYCLFNFCSSILAGLFFRFLELRARFEQDTCADRRDMLKVIIFSLCFLVHRMLLAFNVILISRELRLLCFFFILFVAPRSSSELEIPLRTVYLFPDINA